MHNSHILIVEDSPTCQMLASGALSSLCHVTVVDSYRKALEELSRNRYDLFVLDLALPDGDGLDLCARLKADPETRSHPVIFVSGDNDIRRKAAGFSAGAEDYVVKPYDPLELRVRVEARLRRAKAAPSSSSADARGLTAWGIRLDFSLQKAFIQASQGETWMDLTPTEFRLLSHFMRHEGKALSRQNLLETIWSANVHVVDRTVDKHVSCLRKKLGAHGSKLRSVRGEGYGFFSS